MKVIDLTHVISEEMPVYPGNGKTQKLQQANTYEKDGFKETLLTMYSHTGTRIGPAESSPVWPTDPRWTAFPVSQFVGKALFVIDCRDLKEGETITIDRITKYGSKAVEADYLLSNLGWDARWGTEDYYKDYPCIDDDVVNFILTTDKKGVGLDVIGIDPIPDEDLPIHEKLFKEHEDRRRSKISRIWTSAEMICSGSSHCRLGIGETQTARRCRAIAFWE